MNSIQTKSNNYSLIRGKAVGGVVFVPHQGHFKVYVAWEWEDQAKKRQFAIIEAPHTIGNDMLSGETIDNIANYGRDVTHDKAVRKHFPNLFH